MNKTLRNIWVTVLFYWSTSAERSQASLDPPSPPAILGAEAPDFDYAIILDVGSTGTRAQIHAYEWHPRQCFGTGAAHIMMPGWTHKVRPGLATFWHEQRDQNISLSIQTYFEPLHRFIKTTLRAEDLKRSVLLVRATGGFRYLTQADQTSALDRAYLELRTWGIETHRSWFRVLTGDEEGAFSWLAVNQLARRFFDPYEHLKLHPMITGVTDRARREDPLPGSWLKDNWRAEANGTAGRKVKQRVGMIEVGGASAQIALEPPRHIAEQLIDDYSDPTTARRRHEPLRRVPGNPDFHLLSFCNTDFVLSLQSLDGFGRQAALQKFIRFAAARNHVKLVPNLEFQVPCLPSDVRVPVDPSTDDMIISEEMNVARSQDVAYARGYSQSDAKVCREFVREFFEHSQLKKIPFEVDSSYRIYATENFYYFNEYVNRADASTFRAKDFWERAKELCAQGSSAKVKVMLHAEAAPEKRESACFGLVFLSEFLRSVVSLPVDQVMKAVTAVKDLETSFAVGSLLTELPNIRSRPTKRDEL